VQICLYPSLLKFTFRLFQKTLAPCLVAATVLLPSFAQNAAQTTHIHTIHVDSFGSGGIAAALRQRIIERLNRSGQLKAIDNMASSDAVLRGSSNIWETGSVVLNPRSHSSRETTYQGYLSVELVDKNNQPLWSYLVTPSRFRSGSITDDLANHAADRLLAAVASGAIRGSATESGTSASASTQTTLHAAGATLPQPLYLKWFESSGISVTYNATGSEDGIAQLTAGKVDFAASDMPLTPATSTSQLAVTHIPTVAGGVVPIYNLPGVSSLRFTPQVLAGIYLGTIRRWNDSRIREANRDARLPDAEISVIHRDDGSGTTYVWTSFLTQASTDWQSRVGYSTHVQWLTGTGATGSDGVAALVQKTPNSIGYVELIYAIQHELNYAAVQNPAGQFIKADLASITAAAASAAQPAIQDAGKNFRFSILNAPGKSAYPISTFTWLLIPTHGLDVQKKSAITALLRWMLTTGQKECSSLGYAPLPHEVAARALQAVDTLH